MPSDNCDDLILISYADNKNGAKLRPNSCKFVHAVPQLKIEVINTLKGALRHISFIGMSIVTFIVAITNSLPAARAQLSPLQNEYKSVSETDFTQGRGLAQQVALIRSRILQIQTTFDKNNQTVSVGAITARSALPIGSRLPGFPGSSRIYHVGSTGFFLDYSAAINLTTTQLAALNAVMEVSNRDLLAAQRQIDHAEQELWKFARFEQSDSMELDAKIRSIERMKGDQRTAFIRSVGEAASVLTQKQRTALVGTTAPQAEQNTDPQKSSGSIPKEGMSSTDTKTDTPNTSGNPGMEGM